MENDDKGLTEGEVALMDAIKTLAEVIMYVAPGSEKYLARSFEFQANGKVQSGQPDAAAMLMLLRDFVISPERAANREAVRTLLEKSPQGQA